MMPLPWPGLAGRDWYLTDLLAEHVFERNGAELASPGLYVALGPWEYHLLSVR